MDSGSFRSVVLMIADGIGEALRDFMDSNGFRYRHSAARRPDAVLEELGKDHYDLVVLTDDALEPHRLGEAVRAVVLAFPNVRIVVASARDDDEARADWAASGADAVLPLPFRALDLVDTINGLVRPRQ